LEKWGFGIYGKTLYFFAPQTCKKPRNFLGFLGRHLFCATEMVDDVGLEARVGFSGGADVADVLEFSLCFHPVRQIRSPFFRIYRPGGHRNGGF